jgi:hypothetical protein
MKEATDLTGFSTKFVALQVLSVTATLVGACGVVGAVLFSNCSAMTPSAKAVRAADQFYASISKGEFEAAVRMCGRKMLEETPPTVLLARLARRQNQLGVLVARRQVSVLLSVVHGSSLRGTITKFHFSCDYTSGRMLEVLEVFEPASGGNPEIYSYRFEIVLDSAEPVAN